jgi:hypothetical protein
VASLGGTPRKILSTRTGVGDSPDGSRVCSVAGMPHQQADTLIVAEIASRQEKSSFASSLPETFRSFRLSPDG